MPLVILPSNEKHATRQELIVAALQRLHGLGHKELPINQKIQEDREWIERISQEYEAKFKMPGIADARHALKKMADKAANLANFYRANRHALILGGQPTTQMTRSKLRTKNGGKPKMQ